MEADLLLPSNDLVFKLLFGNPDNTELLTDFLQSVLELPKEEYEKVTVMNPILSLDFPSEKLGILDVKIETKLGKVIDVEIQVQNKSNFKQRILFYLARMVIGQIETGEDYSKIKQSISIVITNFTLIPENQTYHNRFHLYDKNTQACFSNLLEINTLELTKLPKSKEDSKLYKWLQFFKVKNQKELEMIAQNNPTSPVDLALSRLAELSADKRARLMYEQREKWELDELNDRNAARREGLAEGRQQGRQQGKQEGFSTVALTMLKMNKPLEEITAITGLTEAQIATLGCTTGGIT